MSPPKGSTETVGQLESPENRSYEFSEVYYPLDGTSINIFYLKMIPENVRKDLDKGKEVSYEAIYNLCGQTSVCGSEDSSEYRHTLNICESIEKFMERNEMWIDVPLLDNEEDINWLRSVNYKEFFRFNLSSNDANITNLRFDPRHIDDIEELSTNMKCLNITEAKPDEVQSIAKKLMKAIRLSLLRYENPAFRSPRMKSFYEGLRETYERNPRFAELYMRYLFTMHKLVIGYDMVRKSVLERFTGDMRKSIEETKGWTQFFERIKIDKERVSTDVFEGEYRPKILDRAKFTASITGPQRNSELFSKIFDMLSEYEKYISKFQTAFGMDFLMYFSMNPQIQDMIAVLSKGMELDDVAKKDSELANLLKPRQASELCEMGENNDGGLSYIKKIMDYKPTFMRIGTHVDETDKDLLLPKIIMSSLPKFSNTENVAITSLKMMKCGGLSDKIFEESDTVKLLSIYTKIERLKDEKTKSVYLNLEECEILERYSKEPIGIKALPLIEQGKLIKPVSGKSVSDKPSSVTLPKKKTNLQSNSRANKTYQSRDRNDKVAGSFHKMVAEPTGNEEDEVLDPDNACYSKPHLNFEEFSPGLDEQWTASLLGTTGTVSDSLTVDSGSDVRLMRMVAKDEKVNLVQVDSGLDTVHVCGKREWFIEGTIRPCPPRTLTMGNDVRHVVDEVGDLYLGTGDQRFRLNHVLYVKGTHGVILSLGKISKGEDDPDTELEQSGDRLLIGWIRDDIRDKSRIRESDIEQVDGEMYVETKRNNHTHMFGYKRRSEGTIRWYRTYFVRNSMYVDFTHFFAPGQLIPAHKGNAETVYHPTVRVFFNSTQGLNQYAQTNLDYEFRLFKMSSNVENFDETAEIERILMLEHLKGHINMRDIVESIKLKRLKTGTKLDDYPELLKSIDISKLTCDTCERTKMRNKSFKLTHRTYEQVGEVISSDLAVGLPMTLQKNVALAIFVDHYSSFVWVRPIRGKHEAAELFPAICALVKTQTEHPVKAFRTDNGGEYMSEKLAKFFEYKGIIHETSVPYVHQQNGKAEVIIRIIFTYMRSVLFKSAMPASFWDVASSYCAHAMNVTFTRHLKFTGESKVAYETMFGHLPSRNHWYIFGSNAIIFIPIEERGPGQKLQPRTIEAIYVGIAPSQCAALFYVPEIRGYKSAVRYNIDDGKFTYAKALIPDNYDLLSDPIWKNITPEDFQSSVLLPEYSVFGPERPPKANVPDIANTQTQSFRFNNKGIADFAVNTNKSEKVKGSTVQQSASTVSNDVDMLNSAVSSDVTRQEESTRVQDAVDSVLVDTPEVAHQEEFGFPSETQNESVDDKDHQTIMSNLPTPTEPNDVVEAPQVLNTHLEPQTSDVGEVSGSGEVDQRNSVEDSSNVNPNIAQSPAGERVEDLVHAEDSNIEDLLNVERDVAETLQIVSECGTANKSKQVDSVSETEDVSEQPQEENVRRSGRTRKPTKKFEADDGVEVNDFHAEKRKGKSYLRHKVKSDKRSKKRGREEVDDHQTEQEGKKTRFRKIQYNKVVTKLRKFILDARGEPESSDKILLSQVTIPRTPKDVRKSGFPYAWKWKAAEEDELHSLEEKETYVDLEPDEKVSPKDVLRTKWVYTVKDNCGVVEKFKARLVACGYSQVEGRDYDYVFAPTLAVKILRVMLALAAYNHMHIHQLDITTAFLNSPIDKTIYVRVNEKVKRLLKSLYGLKQSPRQWYLLLKQSLLSFGFQLVDSDSNTFFRGYGVNRVFAVVYVDDILIMSTNKEQLEQIKKAILDTYSGKDFGEVKKFLGLNITYDRLNGIIKLDALEYTNKFLLENGCDGIHPRKCPMIKDWPDLSKNEEQNRLLPAGHKHRYMVVLGSLRYIATVVRLDICYALRRLSHFMSAPSFHHMKALDQVVAYVAGSRDMGFVYSSKNFDIEAYADASFNPSYEDCQGVNGYVILFCGGPVVWNSKRITIRVGSTKEAELVALSSCTRELEFVRSLLQDLGHSIQPTTTIYEDNQPLIKSLDKGKVFTTHFLNQKLRNVLNGLETGDWKLEYVKTNDQLADVLTKSLVQESFWHPLRKLNLRTGGVQMDKRDDGRLEEVSTGSFSEENEIQQKEEC